MKRVSTQINKSFKIHGQMCVCVEEKIQRLVNRKRITFAKAYLDHDGDVKYVIFQSCPRSVTRSSDMSDQTHQPKYQWEKVRSKFREVSTEIVTAAIGPKRVLLRSLSLPVHAAVDSTRPTETR